MTSPNIFIIDTNVLVAGLITSQPLSPTVLIVDAMIDGDILFLISPELILEYRTVLLRNKLLHLHKLNEHQVDNLLTEITANAIWHETVPDSADQAPDPGDSHLWALLATEPSATLVTGNKLLYANPPKHNSVISPANFVKFFLR